MGDQTSRAPGFAFIKAGEFSHINQQVLAQLKARFPHLQPTIIDLRELNVVRKRDVPGLVLSVASEFGLSACLSTKKLRWHMYKTSYMFRRTRAALLQRMRGTNYAFTFQTQTMFDASLPNVPHFIYTDHTHLENRNYPVPEAATPLSMTWAAMEKGAYRNARMVFTMSRNISRSLISEYGCSPQKVKCIYAGSNVSTEMSGSIDTSRFSAKNILFVGVDWERKGGPVLLEAFRTLRRTHPEARLTIVGCSPEISEPGVHIEGRVPLSEVAKYYRSASVFCLPTLNEPFGLVYLEAAAFGLPVVATRLGAIPEIVIDGKTGYLVEPQNAAELAARLDDLLRDPRRAEQFGAHGREWVSHRYSWEETGHRLFAHIKRAIRRSARDKSQVSVSAAQRTTLVAPV
ncbi:MAG: glycosyltransferase family 4 protein [Steroidobacteraceae bacterium]